MRSHISTASSMLWVTIRIDLDGDALLLPEVEQVGAQRLGGQHVERGERLVHQQDFRLHDERAREADALAHAAGKLLGIGAFEAVEADRVDRLQRALAGLARRRRRCARGPISTLSSTVSQGNSAKLWNTIATPSAGPSTGLPSSVTLPSVGRLRPATMRSSVDLPQPERPSSADDLAAAQRQRDVLQHGRRRLARALWRRSG